MATVTNTLNLPGAAPANAAVKVTIELLGGGFDVSAPQEDEIIGVRIADVDNTGKWTVAGLVPNSLIEAPASFYRAIERVGSVSKTWQFVVPAPVAVVSASRTANVVTAVVSSLDHGIEVGDSITVNLSDNTYDGTFVVTGVSGTSITWAQTAGDDASGGSGTLDKVAWDLFDLLTEGMVENPAFAASAAATQAEVVELIERGAAGFIRSLDPKSALAAFVQNSTAETSVLNAVQPQSRIINAAVYRMVAFGLCRCTAGGPVNMTVRLKNVTDGTTLCSAVVQLATDTEGNRPWRFDVTGEGAVVLAADSVLSVGRLEVGAGNTDTLKQAMGQAAVGFGSDPQNWDVTVQFSVANAGILAFVYSAQMYYALAG